MRAIRVKPLFGTVGVLTTFAVLVPTASLFAASDVSVAFTNVVGVMNPKLHSAGWGPRIVPRGFRQDEAELQPLGLYAARTHDWALINPGQRVVDTHFVFPLMHLDASDPRNYYFKATDDLLNLSRKMGLKIFYRLGTSIEHSGDRHYNILPPDDYEKYAEVLAGIMRHYLKGWADGFFWADDFDGWEIWNEPDGITNSWGGNGMEAKELRAEFVRFFVTVLKRLKAEFPDQQIGGPALCHFNREYLVELLKGCKEAGVAPDFISWHCYILDGAICEGMESVHEFFVQQGFPNIRSVLDEWHYIKTWDGIWGSSTPASLRRVHEGPTGHNNIDSGVFNLSMLILLQTVGYDEAFYYGCGEKGSWGYRNADGTLNKCWYSMKMFGDLLRRTKSRVAVSVSDPQRRTVSALAGYSADGKSASLLVVDYRGRHDTLTIDLNGLSQPKRIEALVLDHTRDMAPVQFAYENGVLKLFRADENSAAFLVTFEL